MKSKFTPVAIFRHGILYQDGRMAYVDYAGKWLYVSEDGMEAYLYDDVSDMIRDKYKHDDNEDYVVTGWDMDPTRFENPIDDAYSYYNARFEQ